MSNVGYKKPPESHQFKPGQSGNPKGRPKNRLSMASLIHKVYGKKITVTEGGKTLRVTKAELLITQIVNKGVSGELKAAAIALELMRCLDEGDIHQAEKILSKADQEILARFGGLKEKATEDDADGDE